MDNLILDADSLFAIADVISGYCAHQRETLNVYYAQIMALESEWRDDETFGAIAEEINKLKTNAVFVLDEINEMYPKYFREKARLILSRPIMQTSASVESNKILSDVANQGRSINTSSYSTSDTPSSERYVPSAPTGTVPNSFSSTKQSWHQNNPYTKVFNSPKETGSFLNCNQGVPVSMGGEGVEGFRGTCGLVSCENILRMAGVKITEEEIVTYARQSGYCTQNNTPEKNGGTYHLDRQAILSHYGIESKIENSTDMERIAKYVTEGRGVIISVDAYTLWYGDTSTFKATSVPARHAITVTSVERDSVTDVITAFYVCDSGSGNFDNARKVPVDVFAAAVQATGGLMNITNSIIR